MELDNSLIIFSKGAEVWASDNHRWLISLPFIQLNQQPDGLNAGPFNCLLTHLSQSKLYLSKFLFPSIMQSVPVSRRKSVLLKTRTMLSSVAIFYSFFLVQVSTAHSTWINHQIKEGKKESSLLSQRSSIICRHSLQSKSYFIELLLIYEYIIQTYIFIILWHLCEAEFR